MSVPCLHLVQGTLQEAQPVYSNHFCAHATLLHKYCCIQLKQYPNALAAGGN